jgi:hypothetical protein
MYDVGRGNMIFWVRSRFAVARGKTCSLPALEGDYKALRAPKQRYFRDLAFSFAVIFDCFLYHGFSS